MRVAPRGTALLVGVEHEVYVRRHRRPVDFGTLIDRIGLPGRRIDPYDQRAYRLTNGHMITVDEIEAEYAIAPVTVEPGFLDGVSESCGIAADVLRAHVPSSMGLVGASTHVSVSVPDLYSARVAAMITQHFAPALMLLADDHRSFGLLVRPRFGRVEFGLDYVTGADLRALVAACTAAVACCVDILGGEVDEDVLPVRLAPRWRKASRRPGYYIDRRSVGGDLYTYGRATLLRARDGDRIEAGEHLQAAWKAVRPSLEARAGSLELAEVDDVVAGLAPLPVEKNKGLALSSATQRPRPNVFADAMVPIRRPAFRAEIALLSWDLGVFAIHGSRRALAVVPRADLAEFVIELRDGGLDDWVEGYLRRPGESRRVPDYPDAAARVDLYDLPAARLRVATPDRTFDDRLWLEDGSPLVGPRLLPPAQPTETWLSDVDPSSAPVLRSVTRADAGGTAVSGETEARSAARKAEPPRYMRPAGTPTPTTPIPWKWIVAAIAAILVLIAIFSGGDGEPDASAPDPSAPATPDPPADDSPTGGTPPADAPSDDAVPDETSTGDSAPGPTVPQQAACNVGDDPPPSGDLEGIAAAADDPVARAELASVVTFTGYAMGSHIFTMGVAGDAQTVATDPLTAWYNPRFIVNHDEFNVPLDDTAFTVDVGWGRDGAAEVDVFDATFSRLPDVISSVEWLDQSTLVVTVSSPAIDPLDVIDVRLSLTARLRDAGGVELVTTEGNGCWSPG